VRISIEEKPGIISIDDDDKFGMDFEE